MHNATYSIFQSWSVVLVLISIHGSVWLPSQLLSILYGCLQLALLVQLGVTSNLKTRSTMAAAVLSVLVALTICLLSYIEHRNSFRPSILLTGYFLLTILFDAARTRTMWIADEDKAISITFSITVAVKLGMIILENTDKTVLPNKAPYSKEERAGLFGKSLFLWLNSLMTQGFRKSLLPADLRPVDSQMLHQGLSQKFQSLWGGSFCKLEYSNGWHLPGILLNLVLVKSDL